MRIPSVRLASRCWLPALALTMGLWFSRRVHLEFVYLGAGMAFTLLLVRFVVADAERGRGTGEEPRTFPTLLGLSSYPTYLFHGPILLVVGSVLRYRGLASPWWLVWAVGTGIAIAIGLVLGRIAERPLMAWRAGYLKRLKQSDSRTVRGRGPDPRHPAMRPPTGR